jgi:succinyl-CoA synthetase beta subunit
LDEALLICKDFFKQIIDGFPVEAILIEDLVNIDHEYYCSIALDASARQYYLIASKEGGIDIEGVAANRPLMIVKKPFSFKEGLTNKIAKEVGYKLDFTGELLDLAVDLFLKLWEIVLKTDAQLVEINPFVSTSSRLIALDAKMILDENAHFRQPIIKDLQERKLSDLEKEAKEAGFSFLELDGDIGILANGAGLTMALIDFLSQLGLKPANFLDVGGGASKERVYKALELLFKLKPKGVLINIFGGITRCDDVAGAIIEALHDFKDVPPMVIRLNGTNETEGLSLLDKAGIVAYQNVMEAIENFKNIIGE